MDIGVRPGLGLLRRAARPRRLVQRQRVAERRIEAVRLGDRLFFDPTEVARFKSEREAA